LVVAKEGKAPQLLYRELDLSVRIVRDYITQEVHKIVIDDVAVGERIEALLKDMDRENVGVGVLQRQGRPF